MSQFTPGDVATAVRENQSLWMGGENEIRRYIAKIPTIEQFGKTLVSSIETEYGSVTSLVVLWLKEDQPMKYGMIVNTPGGMEWLDRQVNDILRGIGLKDGV